MSNPNGVTCATCAFFAHGPGECRAQPRVLDANPRHWCGAHPAFWGPAIEEETPLGQATEEVLDALLPWARSAARVPRETGSPEDVLLEAVKRWLVIRADSEDEETT